jgi:hypothetical protein
MKYYFDVNYEGFPVSNLTEDTFNPVYFRGDNFKLPPRKFFPADPKLIVSPLSGLGASKYVFVRNIALFADYIHPNIYFHYQ